jgi:integrase
LGFALVQVDMPRLIAYTQSYVDLRPIRPDTRELYIKCVRWLVEFVGEDLPIDRFTEAHMLAYKNHVLSTNKPSTFNLRRRHLKVIFSHAVNEGLITRSPWLRIKPESAPDVALRRVANEELNRILHYLDTSEALEHPGLQPTWFWSAFLKTLRMTGMRIRQLRTLTWGDIDFKKRLIYLESAGSKNKKRNVIPLPLKLYQPLLGLQFQLARVRTRPEKHVKVFNYSIHPSSFSAGNGGKKVLRDDLSNDQVAYFFKALYKATGLKMSSHMLRHTLGSELARRTGNLRLVQKILDHSSVSVSAIYVHPDIEELRKAMDLVNDEIE